VLVAHDNDSQVGFEVAVHDRVWKDSYRNHAAAAPAGRADARVFEQQLDDALYLAQKPIRNALARLRFVEVERIGDVLLGTRME
jgi:hypothetical protein